MDNKEKQTGEHNVFDYANYGKDLEKSKPKPTPLSKENSSEVVKQSQISIKKENETECHVML